MLVSLVVPDSSIGLLVYFFPFLFFRLHHLYCFIFKFTNYLFCQLQTAFEFLLEFVSRLYSFFLSVSAGDQPRGRKHTLQALYHLTIPLGPKYVIISDDVPCSCLGWPRTPALTSWVDGITGLCDCPWLWFLFMISIFIYGLILFAQHFPDLL